MKQLRGPLTVKEDHRALSPTERMPWHCSEIERRGAVAVPCPEEAVQVHERPDGVRVGYCGRHRVKAA